VTVFDGGGGEMIPIDPWEKMGGLGGAAKCRRVARRPGVGPQNPLQNPRPVYVRPQGKEVNDCLDQAYREYRTAWNAAGLSPTRTALGFLNAYRPHLDDIIPLTLSGIAGHWPKRGLDR